MYFTTKGTSKMKKCIVEPKASVTLLNTNGDAIHHNRPTLTTMTQFIESKLQDGTIRVLARHLPKEASDAKFHVTYKELEGNSKQAVHAYCAEFGLTPDGEELETEIDLENLPDEEDETDDETEDEE